MLSLLYDPGSFFEEREPGLIGPLLVVVVVAGLALVTGVIGVLVSADMVAQTVPEAPAGTDDPFAPGGQDPAGTEPVDSEFVAGFTAISGAVGLVLGLIWLAFVLFFYAGSFHVLSALFGGEGSFLNTLAVAGWGFAPKILVELVGLAAAGYTALVWMTSESPTAGEPIEPVIGPAGTFLLGLVTIGALFWSAYIWYHGVTKVRNVDTTGAVVSVGLPVFVAFVFNLVVLALSVLLVAGAGQAA